MTGSRNVIAALVADGDGVDRMVAGLDESQWALPTPAPGWTVAHQIAHLSFVFQLAAAAASAPERFNTLVARANGGVDGVVDAAFASAVNDPPARLLARWRIDRAAAERALAVAPADSPVPWLVRPVPPAVLAAVGMMELFGHGQDIADALGIHRRWTDRLRYVVGFAVDAWDLGYQARGLTPPDVRFGFELVAPSGEVWRFGPDDAQQHISGTAADFCLLVTRRRHRDDLDLAAVGQEAHRWLDIAQAYHGAPGPGRSPGQFAPSFRRLAA